MPTPRRNESEREFTNRCMGDPVMTEEYPDESQRRAVCQKQWDNGKKALTQDFSRVRDAIDNHAWAILPEKLQAIDEVMEKRMAGDNEAFLIEIGGKDSTSYMQINPDGIAVISIMGVMGRRMNIIEKASGGVSSEILLKDMERAIDSPDVLGMILHFDSPGGMVDGTRELAEYVSMAGQIKPIVAYTDGVMASAAYWMGSAAGEIIAYPTAQVGSIGVVTMHVDRSGQDKKAGIQRTFVYNGKYKRIAADNKPLDDEGKSYLQEMVDGIYEIMVKDIAGFRGADPEDIYGQESRVYLAGQALKQGLVDKVGSFNDAYTNLKRRIGIMDKNELKTQYGSLYQEVKEEGIAGASANDIAEHHPEKIDAWKQEGMEQERKRIAEIREAAFDGQDELVDKLIAEGVTADDARKRLIADQKGRVQNDLKTIENQDTGDLGANPDGGVKSNVKATAKTKDEAGDKLTEIAKGIQADEMCGFGKAFDKAMSQNPELAKVYNGK
jgi:signal peptide peptidase SppA